MSQIFKPLTSSGPIPPIIPTSFVTDDGTAIPALNVLNVNGLDSIENDTDGIFTRADPNLSNNLQVILSNRISVTATTTDATPALVTVMTPATATSVTFRVLITAYDSANDEATGGELLGLARALGGVATVVGTNDAFDEADAPLAAVDWDIVATGADLQVSFTGIVGRTLEWRALFDYTQAP